LVHASLRFTHDSTHLPFRHVHSYRTNVRRAKNLISNMKNGFDGVMANVDPLHPNKARDSFLALDAQLDIAVSRAVSLVHIAGFAGCGKSYPVQKLLKTHPFSAFKVSVPTTELRSEWKEALELSSTTAWRISTWEASLLKSARVLVIDEVYKMPRGYLDLAIHADPTIQFVIVLGDPLQGEYHSTNTNSSNHRLPSEISHLRPYLDFYCLWSRRIPQRVAKFFGVRSLSSQPGFSRFHQTLPPNATIMCNSQTSALTISQCGYKAVTIASSQGSTYKYPANIHLDRNSRMLSHSMSLVALTRSTVGINFSGDHSLIRTDSACNNLLFSRFHANQPISLSDIFRNMLTGVEIITEPLASRVTPLRGARSELPTDLLPIFSLQSNETTDPIIAPVFRPLAEIVSRSSHVPLRPNPSIPGVLSLTASLPSSYMSDVLQTARIFSGDGSEASPQISTHFLPETRRPFHYDIPSTQVSSPAFSSDLRPSSTAHTPVYPGEDFYVLASQFIPAHDPQVKEIIWRDQSSNQFPLLNQPFEISALPFSVASAIHSEKSDPTLLPASIPKRLRFRPSPAPYSISPKDEILGAVLFQSLCRAYHRSPLSEVPFDEALFIECINANEFCQLSSKTQSVIMANANRSDPDWRWAAVRIFSKTQHKTNDNSIFGNWKACQTLALMHDAVILLLGPVKKYQRIFDSKDRPSNIYVHAGHTPFELSQWCQDHLTDQPHLANDYTAFDQSQHGEAVVLERLKMHRLSIPQALIDLHVHLKTNVDTQFGPLTCMRLTGEPGTYDDNTDYNLAVLFTQYNITSEAVMVSGDDSLIDSIPPLNQAWPSIQPLLSLRFKIEIDKYALFCGYFVGPSGACRSPLALFTKLAMAIDDNSIPDKLVSYLTEFSVGHSLGQSMWNLLPLSHISFQSACFDFFCRHAPPALKVALNIGEIPSSTINSILSALSSITAPVWSMLPVAARRVFIASKRSPISSFLPIASPNEGELLPELHNDQADTHIIRHLQDFQVNTPSIAAPLPLLFGAAPIPTPSMDFSFLLPLLQSLSRSHVPSIASPPQEPGAVPDAGSRVIPPPQLPSPSPPIATAKSPSAGVSRQFQWIYYDLNGQESKITSQDIANATPIIHLSTPFRYAKLVELEALITPMAISYKYPITIDLAWTTNDQSLTAENIMNTYGSQRVSFGGPLGISSSISIPCPLLSLNPIIKDSTKYYDTPRLHASFHQNADCVDLKSKAPICGTVLIRGKLLLDSPSISPTLTT
jgi:hypothetical protein